MPRRRTVVPWLPIGRTFLHRSLTGCIACNQDVGPHGFSSQGDRSPSTEESQELRGNRWPILIGSRRG